MKTPQPSGTVTSSDFKRIREVFERTLEQPSEARRAFVEEACGGNTLLVAEVQRMLAANARADRLLDHTPARSERIGACPSCHAALAPDDRFCRQCGTPTHGSGRDEGRFRAGALFANRFRIVARLGRGGMGEVYRADDLEVGQPVALKFLTGPAKAGHYSVFDERARARLRSEVRLARQISHPNVCRVYDIGESQGELYLSMEYVDGEDLAALLTRIGRLPIDKGIEIARKLCAGLAAAHAKGVLHRDFKPANIMIDSHGEVRIMDFGLAAIATELEERDVRSGTPAYMAPEQLAGKESTKQSDLYALGLVLYELFTGKAAFEAKSLEHLLQLRQGHPSTTPSTLIPDITPRLERAILKCLEPDPSSRPSSALEVSASLPGGDPLAEALAAGETPSPEMVAASGSTEAVRPLRALALLASIGIGLGAWCWLTPKVQMVGQLPFQHSPEVLAARARDLAASLGYVSPADTAFGFREEAGYVRHVAGTMPDLPAARKARWSQLLATAPSPVVFWYREADAPMSPVNAPYIVTPTDPTPDALGNVTIDLGLDGRLLGFHALPARRETAATADVPPPDWSPLFAAARLDPAQFQQVAESSLRDGHHVAWRGTYPGTGAWPVRVEGESVGGRVSAFDIAFPWREDRSSLIPTAPNDSTVGWLVFFALSIGAIIMARHNVRAGRIDRVGSWRTAASSFVVVLLGMMLTTHGLIGLIRGQVGYAPVGAGFAIAMAAGVWTASYYLALEPLVRRYWPDVLITWSRVVTMRWRDPIVGRDVLIGLLGAVAASCAHRVLYLWVTNTGGTPAGIVGSRFEGIGNAGFGFTLVNLIGINWTVATLLLAVLQAVQGSLGLLATMFIWRVLVRKPWLANLFAVVFLELLSIAPAVVGDTIPLADVVFYVVLGAGLSLLILRFGFLTLTIWVLFGQFVEHAMLTPNFGAWYGQSSLTAVIVVSATALWACYTAVGGRSALNVATVSR